MLDLRKGRVEPHNPTTDEPALRMHLATTSPLTKVEGEVTRPRFIGS